MTEIAHVGSGSSQDANLEPLDTRLARWRDLVRLERVDGLKDC